MIPVYQKLVHSEYVKGDCFRACVASILELPLDKVPNFVEKRLWFDYANEWLGEEYTLALIRSEIDGLACSNCHVILSGKSPRGDFVHAVVGRVHRNHTDLIHDPHPSQDFLKGDPFWFYALGLL